MVLWVETFAETITIQRGTMSVFMVCRLMVKLFFFFQIILCGKRPATGSDSGSEKAPGGLYGGSDPNVAPGALLAIPATIASTLNMTTVVGNKIKQALTDYGGYIVDDTGGGNSAAICMEAAVNAEMRATYGYAMTYPAGVSAAASDPGRYLYKDLLKLFQALHAVTNNGPNSIGGGGQPRCPSKPPICGAPAPRPRNHIS
eukprot:m.58082 g.58082  ORF g.58082 m.58082 type:complete len:201 (+) comp11154_c0_seq4:726-1328(+)